MLFLFKLDTESNSTTNGLAKPSLLFMALLMMLLAGCMSSPSKTPKLLFQEHVLVGRIWDVNQQAFIDHLQSHGIHAVFHYLPLHLSEMGKVQSDGAHIQYGPSGLPGTIMCFNWAYGSDKNGLRFDGGGGWPRTPGIQGTEQGRCRSPTWVRRTRNT